MKSTDQTSSSRKKRIAAIAAFTALTAGGGVAWGLWSAAGAGSGRTTALTAVSVTVTAAAGPASLFPGATNGDIAFTLTNPNPYPVQFTSMTPGTERKRGVICQSRMARRSIADTPSPRTSNW